jgi:hypothetical protein
VEGQRGDITGEAASQAADVTLHLASETFLSFLAAVLLVFMTGSEPSVLSTESWLLPWLASALPQLHSAPFLQEALPVPFTLRLATSPALCPQAVAHWVRATASSEVRQVVSVGSQPVTPCVSDIRGQSRWASPMSETQTWYPPCHYPLPLAWCRSCSCEVPTSGHLWGHSEVMGFVGGWGAQGRFQQRAVRPGRSICTTLLGR